MGHKMASHKLVKRQKPQSGAISNMYEEFCLSKARGICSSPRRGFTTVVTVAEPFVVNAEGGTPNDT